MPDTKSDGFTFVTGIFQFVTEIIQSSISQNIAQITPIIGGVMYAFLGLYAFYLAYNWYMSGNVQLAKDGLGNFILLGIITFIAFKGNYYTTEIVPIILNIGDELGAIIVGSKAVDSGAALDKFLTSIYFAIKAIWERAEFDWGGGNILVSIFNIVCLCFGSIPFIVTTFGILLTAKIMVSLLLSVGTIFICFAFFPQTRQWFSQWLGM